MKRCLALLPEAHCSMQACSLENKISPGFRSSHTGLQKQNICPWRRSRKWCPINFTISEHWCDIEEAYTSLLLHASQASSTFSTVIVMTPDTDVLLLSLSFSLSWDPYWSFCTRRHSSCMQGLGSPPPISQRGASHVFCIACAACLYWMWQCECI